MGCDPGLVACDVRLYCYDVREWRAKGCYLHLRLPDLIPDPNLPDKRAFVSA